MRKLAPFLFLFLAFNAFADEHLEHLKMMMHAMSQHGPVIPQPEGIAAQAAKTFDIQAKCFQFTPSTFTVNQGDVVTLNISVPSNDNAGGCNGIGHGMLMETYVESGINVSRGQTKTVTFTATTAGTFVWVCTQSNCGSGHTSMFGQLMVIAGIPAPTISDV